MRLTPATLTSASAETKINGYVELASLKLDSEWAVSLAGASNNDVPPVSLVFTGALDKAGEISPAVDTAAIEAYLTMRRMQEDVEQLETLDVSGRTMPSAEVPPDDQTSAVPVEPPAELDATGEASAPEPPAAEIEAPATAMPQSAPSAEMLPSATELLREGAEEEIEPADAAEVFPPASEEPQAPPSTSASVDEPAAAKPVPSALPAARRRPRPRKAPRRPSRNPRRRSRRTPKPLRPPLKRWPRSVPSRRPSARQEASGRAARRLEEGHPHVRRRLERL